MRIGQKLNIPLLVISIGNLINGLKRAEDFNYFIWYVGIFALLIPIMFILPEKKDNKIVSKILLTMSCMGIWLGGDFNLVSVTFFCFSIAIIEPKKTTYITYSITILIMAMVKLTFTEINVSQFCVSIAGSSFVVIIYQHYIHPKIKENTNPQGLKKSYDSRKVKDQVVDIVHLKVQGYDWPEINDILMLNVANDRVRRIVTDERKRLGFKNQDEFIFWMTTSGIIKPVPANLVIEA